jgi:hypothetical protein
MDFIITMSGHNFGARSNWREARACQPRPGFDNIAAQYQILATGPRNPALASRL